MFIAVTAEAFCTRV